MRKKKTEEAINTNQPSADESRVESRKNSMFLSEMDKKMPRPQKAFIALLLLAGIIASLGFLSKLVGRGFQKQTSESLTK